MKILIIGVNGFVGSNLAQRILERTDWQIYGMDLYTHYLKEILDYPRFIFCEGDIAINNEWIEYHVKKCDIILPLVAIAQPKLYVTNPLRVFELDFEENLKVIRWTQKYGRRLVFPSTSEVYGMNTEDEFDEKNSNFVQGPTHKLRWIYANCKQLLDRVIFAYGRDRNLRYTIIRPFNWIGPRLDTLKSAENGECRVITQFIYNLIHNQPLKLVGGGSQRRTFTDIEDGLDALMTILENEQATERQIFNLGNPQNYYSIAELARMVRRIYAEVNGVPPENLPPIMEASVKEYYERVDEYQEIAHRVPSIKHAQKLLAWTPKVPFEVSVRKVVKYFCQDYENPSEELIPSF